MFRNLHPTRSLLLAIPIAGAIIAAALAAAWLLRSESDDPESLVPLTLRGIQPEDLEESGVHLYEPLGDLPDFDVADFEGVVKEQQLLGLPREVRLAYLEVDELPDENGLVWAVNIHPWTVPQAGGMTDYALYAIDFLDPETGQHVSSAVAADSCLRAYIHSEYADVIGPVCSGQVRFPPAPEIPAGPPTLARSQTETHPTSPRSAPTESAGQQTLP